MHRDKDLLDELLRLTRDATFQQWSPTVEGRSDDEVFGHMLLLKDQGLVTWGRLNRNNPVTTYGAVRLTDQGHNRLERLERPLPIAGPEIITVDND